MCGIFGYITNQNTKLSPNDRQKRLSISKGLAVAMQSRGDDSTGIATLRGGKVVVDKEIVNAVKFINYQAFDNSLNSPLLIGHTRLATCGLVTKENAHPFTFGKITGVHNGSINNHVEINNSLAVDSQSLFWLLDREELSRVTKRVSGSAAAAWYNSEDKKLYLMAHDNPLTYAYVKSLNTIFFCSTLFGLASVLTTARIDTFEAAELPDKKVLIISPSLSTTTQKVKFGKNHQSYYQDYYKRYPERAEEDYCEYCGKRIYTTPLMLDDMMLCPQCLSSFSGENNELD